MKADLIQKLVLLETALLSSHATSARGAFRARDIRFFVDVFSEWIDPIAQHSDSLNIQNTQIARYLQSLIEEEVLHVQDGSATRKMYRVSLRQLPVFLQRLINRNYVRAPEYALFVYLFLKCYLLPFIENALAVQSRKGASLLIKLKGFADTGLFVEKQLYYVNERLKSFETLFSQQERHSQSIYDDNEQLTSLGQEANAAEQWLAERDEDVNALLARSKSVKTLIAKGGLGRVQWEIQEGQQQRLQLLWKGEVARLVVFKEQLEAIR